MDLRTSAIALSLLATACAGRSDPAPLEVPDAHGLEVACASPGPDTDRDGLSDRCELELAAAFAPSLRVAAGGCNWDTSVAPARLGGEYLFAVESMGADRVRVAYLPAYYRDCGWTGVKCWLPLVDCAAHDGDSEAIMLDLVRDADATSWSVEAVFLSAHCFGSGDDCRWYRGAELERFRWANGRARGAPIVWVADGRQANYPSRSACDGGHSSIDSCDQNDLGYRYPIRDERQNIGSRDVPIDSDGCVTAEALGSSSSLTASDVEECFWTADARFSGWQEAGSGEGVTPYERYLSEIARF